MADAIASKSAAPVVASRSRPWLAVSTLAWRELVRFFRQRNRVFAALGQPIIFWLLFSEGFEGLMGSEHNYIHFFPGTLAMIVLFTAIFATVSVIEDRREGFLQSVLVSPVPPWAMVLGKVLGGSLLALAQAVAFLILGYFTLDLNLGFLGAIHVVALLAAISFALTSLGFLIAWRMESTQGFHAIMMVFLMPMWLLSGSFFRGNTGWLTWVERVNPLTYGVQGLRRLLQHGPDAAAAAQLPSLAWCWLITILFGAVTFALASWLAIRGTRGDYLT